MSGSVELVSTGSELLSGRSVNRHAQTLAELLRPLGLTLARDTTVPDELGAISETVREALRRVDVVFVSGGLGPTSDDVTRDAVARVLGREVVMSNRALNALRQRYQKAGRHVSAESERQALIVEGAEVLLNPVGISPGQRLSTEGRTLFVLPGPPDEFRGVLEAHVLPWLRSYAAGVSTFEERVLMISGIGESDVVTRFERAGFPSEPVDVGYCAGPGRVEVRFTGPAGSSERLDRAVDGAQQLLGDHIFAKERIEIEEVLLRLLSDSNRFLASAEYGTGALLTQRLSCAESAPGVYVGGVVVLDLGVLIDELGVTQEVLDAEGAVSAAVALQLASAARIRYRADVGMALTGVAQKDDAKESQGPGDIMMAGLDDGARRLTHRLRLAGSVERMRAWGVQGGLDWVRRRLRET